MTTPVAATSSTAAVVTRLQPFLAEWIDTQRRAAQVPGVQVAVRLGSELLWSHACGFADLSTGEPLTTRHGFRIASHSKTFTATAVVQLAERGVLRLDDRVRTWVPELEDAPVGEVTLRDLLSHQAGVMRDGEDANFWQLAHPFHDRDSLLRELHKDLVLSPQQHFHYSNLGYSLLGLVIEAATGRGWHEVMLDLVAELRPLTGGPVRLGPEWGVGAQVTMATGHSLPMPLPGRGPTVSEEPRPIAHLDTGAEGAATGFWGTAEAATAWLAAHALGTDRLLSDDSKRLMQRRESTVVEGGVTRWYGLGWLQRELGERHLVGHSGGFPGFITQTWGDPLDGLTVSVFTNRTATPASDWATALVRIIDLGLATASLNGDEVDPDQFGGRFCSSWGTKHLVPIGPRVLDLGVDVADPALIPRRLEVVDPLRLYSPAADGFADFGENTMLTRGPKGSITSVTTTGVTAWPEATYRRKRDALLSGKFL